MQMRRLGASGLRVSEVSFGSWLTLGSAVDHAGTAKLVERAFDLGVNFFDTADVYANGQAELALGRALANLPRQQLVVASKCFFPMSEAATDRGLSRKHISESVEGSLRRLGIDYLDLHQCHRADPETPIDETVRAYEDLIRQGKLLYWGVSQWEAEDIASACERADARNAYRPISNQPVYSIVRRGVEAQVLPTCEREGLGVVVYSPLGQGVLTGKYSQGARPPESRAADPQRKGWMGEYLEAETLERVDRLRPLAAELGVSMPQLALAWCLRTSGVTSVIVGATRAEQLEENCGASGLSIPAAVQAQIEEIFPAPVTQP
jgi:voltage-dependent potassium channel beta subunit